MRARLTIGVIVGLLGACQTLGGFEDYEPARGGDAGRSVADGGEPATNGGGASGTSPNRAGSGGRLPPGGSNGSAGMSPVGGAPAEDGGDGGAPASGGGEPGGAPSAGGTSRGGASGGTNSGGANSGGTGGSVDGGTGGTAGPGAGTGGSAGTGGAVDQCAVQVMEHTITSTSEVAMCAPITHATNPPCEGEHYSDAAAYGTYDTPVPKGFLVHSVLHGGIVVWYNCPEGCAAELERVAQWAEALPEDVECVPDGVPRRLIVVPDPELTVRWAASAWGWTLRAPCFDPVAFGEFYDAHYDLAPESWCLGLDVQPTTCDGSGS